MKHIKLLILILFISLNISCELLAQALSFQNNSYVEVPDNPALRITNNLTIEAMVYLDDLSNNTIVDKGNYNYLFQTNPWDIPGIGFYNPNTGWIWSAGSVPVHQWVHIAVTIQSGTNGVKFYLNGNLLSQHTMNAPALHSDSGPVNIGRQDPSACRCNFFHGDMDELRIWNRVRTQAEIQANMNASLNPAAESNLVAYYKFDNVSNCTVIDSKNGFNGTIMGTNGNCTTIPSPISSVDIQQVTLTSNSQILNDGRLISSSNYGFNAPFAKVNGVCFEPNTSNSGLSNFVTSGSNGFDVNPVSPELHAVLQGLVFQPNGGASTLTINGLTPGHRHRLQLLFSNDINSTGNNVNITIEGRTYNLTSWIPSSVNLVAEFTPSATSTVVTFGSNSGAEPNRAVFNAYAIHDLDLSSVPCGNTAPVANAGSDQTINCAPPDGSSVTLDGSGSIDDDGDALTYSWSLNGNAVSTSASFTTTLAGGTYTFTLTISDGQSSSSDDVTVTVNVDNTAPVLSVPQNISVNNDEGECGAVVNFEVTASDECGSVTVSSIPASGSLFPTGVTTVTCTAVDNAGNTATQTFTVTVIDNEAPVITLNGANPVEVVRFSQYNEDGVTITDNCSSNLTAVISGSVNVNLPGVYTITYSTGDASGNTASTIRTVRVINDPSALATPYLLLADKEIKSDKNVNANGKIHSNRKITLDKGPANYVSDITSVNKIEIKKDVTVNGNVTSGNKVSLDKNVVVTGFVTQFGLVNTVPLPSLTYSAPPSTDDDNDDDDDCNLGEDIKVGRNQTLALSPGTYNKVEVKKGGTLTLTAGEYLICKIKLEDGSTLIADVSAGEISINTIRDVHFEANVTTTLLPLGESDSRYFAINTLKNIHVGKDSKVIGSLTAPYGNVHIDKNVYFKGSIIGKDIHVDQKSVLNYHDTNTGILAKVTSDFTSENFLDESVAVENESLPENFSLKQNYPNPFNPATTISFQLPESGFVTLKVYDILGNEIKTLINNDLGAGYYNVDFDGSNLASGIYIYRLTAGKFTHSNKMILSK
ncbi:MAG: LamG-like jellyroll fold domain-containing protein [Bacteroidota bacterium]